MNMFGLFEIIFPLAFLLILVVFVVVFAKIITEWNKNNHSPRLTVDATVVAKRSSTHHSAGNDHMMASTSTTYYATFQVESGDRMELQIPHSQFGYLVEGDMGRLTFQGTRFLTFDRV